ALMHSPHARGMHGSQIGKIVGRDKADGTESRLVDKGADFANVRESNRLAILTHEEGRGKVAIIAAFDGRASTVGPIKGEDQSACRVEGEGFVVASSRVGSRVIKCKARANRSCKPTLKSFLHPRGDLITLLSR